MSNALKIGSAAGIGIFLHWTFGLLLIGLFAFYLFQGSSVAGALLGVVMIMAVFGCVVLHELGHALMARRYGVPTRDITLYPIGGVARLQRIPEEPMHELWIAVAGPAVNLVIALLLLVGIWATGGSFSVESAATLQGDFIESLMWINLILFGFNLLPAFPMDGGRVLRALLALRIPYPRATQIAANVGQGMAILFGLLGLLAFNPILLFIALFVYIGAQQEAKQALMRSVTEGVPVREAMMTRFHALTPDDTLEVAIEELLAGAEQDFPVLTDGRVTGVLTRKMLMKALAEHGRGARVGDVVTGACVPLDDSIMLNEAFEKMQAADCTSAPVLRHGHLVGMLTLENVGELMMISSALKKGGVSRGIEAVRPITPPDPTEAPRPPGR